ncbi:MAG: Toxic cation resistance protein, partial [Chloroflexota bacterium]
MTEPERPVPDEPIQDPPDEPQGTEPLPADEPDESAIAGEDEIEAPAGRAETDVSEVPDAGAGPEAAATPEAEPAAEPEA